jgi:polyphenol oxidase
VPPTWQVASYNNLPLAMWVALYYYINEVNFLEKYIIDKYEFIKQTIGNANLIFSTSTNNLNFNINTDEGRANLMKLKDWFNLKEIGFLKQIHSNLVYNYDSEIHQGDGIITNRKNIGIGVFTADCVPILIYDKANHVIAAVHSGWKGTLNEVVVMALSKLKSEYGCIMKDLIAYIGPHNRGCCYEIGEDVKQLFLNKELYKGMEIIKDNRLNLEKCITKQLASIGMDNENILNTNVCTFCNENYELYSYRKQKEDYGRMFSFIYMD